MPDALPVPRDQREREAMKAAWDGAIQHAEVVEDRLTVLSADRAIPPVAPASPMPELACPWVLLSPDGQTDGAMYRTAQDAKALKLPAERLARLAVVEVVEPEPQAAPSGWRYVWFPEPDNSSRRSLRMLCGDPSRPRVDHANHPLVPPIDREHVAALLRAAKGGTDATG